MDHLYCGVDVQSRRPCAYAIIDDDARSLTAGWCRTAAELTAIIERHAGRSVIAVGVDAPRQPLRLPRPWYWSAAKGWRRRRPSEVGRGRHCEVVIAAHGIAKPQWTPLSAAAPRWMQIGFDLFAALHESVVVYEVFPSASYALLTSDSDSCTTIDLARFAPGPKDMLDAYMSAFTVREFIAGRGMAVGDGDGLGAIVLPRPLPRSIPRVLTWPSS